MTEILPRSKLKLKDKPKGSNENFEFWSDSDCQSLDILSLFTYNQTAARTVIEVNPIDGYGNYEFRQAMWMGGYRLQQLNFLTIYCQSPGGDAAAVLYRHSILYDIY